MDFDEINASRQQKRSQAFEDAWYFCLGKNFDYAKSIIQQAYREHIISLSERDRALAEISLKQPPTQALRGRNLDLEPYGQGKGD